MKSPLAYLAIILFWAVLYLPGLGNREIRGEEWRRTLPGRTMLNTGEWIVTYSGGLPYVRKPPLINWVSAASFKITGRQNEWTARLPSVLLMLGGALGIYAFSKRVMGGDAAFVGTVFFLTSVGCIEKGRIAEIEVYYIALTGVAFAAWLAGFTGRLNRWVAWMAAGFFLGLAFLSKGPVHLLFFYLIVLGACWKTKRWNELWSLPHLAGLALCLAMILAWAIPFMQGYGRLIQEQPWLVQDASMGALDSWRHELASRVTGEEESSTKDWLVRGPRALVMFLPWLLFVPLWWRKGVVESVFSDEKTRRVYRGLCWGVAAGFAVMVLLPSSSPRYVAPLLGPVALMLGWIVTLHSARVTQINKTWRWIAWGMMVLCCLIFVVLMFITFMPPGPVPPSGWQLCILVLGALAGIGGYRRLAGQESTPTVVGSSFLTLAACAFIIFGYVWIGMWQSGRSENVRPTGLAIREAMEPKDAPLYVFHLGQTPYPFYLPEDTRELYDLSQLPETGVRWMLTTVKVDSSFRRWFERRYGEVTKVGEWTGGWGDKDQDANRRMVLLRFAGR